MLPRKMILCLVLVVALLAGGNHSQRASPCPQIFQYDDSNESDKWYGTITLMSDADLAGVWLRVIFDRPSIQLGNWFGEVVTTDNKEYLIKNRNHQLKANVPQKVRFYVKYNPSEPIPNLVGFRLNAKTVCPAGGITTPAPQLEGQLLTSSVLVTTPRPSNNGGSQQQQTFARPGGGFTVDHVRPGSEEDDFFQGDFSIVGKPSSGGHLDVACGTVVVQPRPLITHGQATHEGQFPWHVALYHSRGIDLTYICGASLISRSHVITVAHCVMRTKTQLPLNPDSLLVYFGKYYLKRWSNTGIQDRQVHSIHPHPNYNAKSYSNDIAILKLASPVEVTDYVRPVCLWEESSDLNSVLSKPGTVVGWGFDENGRVTEQLTQAKMPVVSQETCIYSFPDFYSRFTSSKTYCAGFKNGTSVCNGDSGGGMVFPKTGSNPHNPVWQLRGLVSISVALQNQFKCDSSHYVVFTDVAKYLDWIKNAISY